MLALGCIDAQAALKHGRATITVDAADFLSIATFVADIRHQLLTRELVAV